ncbi:hypothetical protein RvY_10718 [Ramazzottius varieornatus]|uniref:Uncharacterized protein n=1 Tax=Ramazzottius varieornatus TaxID=947166 RepID=A0A1D1VDQ2_RAMVA|nr:hypothetical protein RvY_10718 [Ramazzottius varieornatus]
MIVMCACKEPLEVLVASLDSLKQQTVAKHLFFVVALEEKPPDVTAKTQNLINRYAGVFLHLMVTVHPFGVPAELPGKSSNSKYGARQGVAQMHD